MKEAYIKTVIIIFMKIITGQNLLIELQEASKNKIGFCRMIKKIKVAMKILEASLELKEIIFVQNKQIK
jgi:hypothetical protein